MTGDGEDDQLPAKDFDSFYRQTVNAVFAHAVTTARGDREVAKDAVQEAYVALWKCWPRRTAISLRENRKYILVIVFNKVMDHYRKVVRLKERELDEDVDVTPELPIDRLVDQLAVDDAVRRFLYAVPARRHAVARLCFLEELSYSEVAEMLGISESTVRNHVKRVRDVAIDLRRLIDPDQGGVR